MLTTDSLIRLLIELGIGAIIIYAVYLFLGMLQLPQPVRTIILLIIAVIALVFLASLFGINI